MAKDHTFTEDTYEQTLIELFRDELDYQYQCGYDIEHDPRVPYLPDVLRKAIEKLNPGLPPSTLDDAIKRITTLSVGTLVQNNEAFTDMMQGGVPAQLPPVKGQPERTVLVKLIDYDNPLANDFRIVNQWTVEQFQKRRCDMVVFVNGLPLVVIELKSALAENASIHDAFLQIKNYQAVVPDLFTFNAFNVISDLTDTRAGTITANESRYMEWKVPHTRNQAIDYRTLFLEVFRKEQLLDILRNFICFDRNEGHVGKILTAYHQYYAVNKALKRAQQAVAGNGKIGVFWHTQGSGKSLSMVFFAHLLIQNLAECTLVVVTDRKDLDNQLFGQFSRCKNFLRQTPQKAESRKELAKLLKGRVSGGVIFTTIQKFEEGDGELSDRRNIVVMTDEAHRSQYGDEHWDNKDLRMKKGFSLKMREALPNASFIGFTGTPLSDRDRDTQEVFGDYIDIYDMTQAVEDGATRPVYYESRVLNLELDEKVLELLDKEFDDLADEGASDEQLTKTKHELARLEGILGDDKTITSLVKDIIQHYEENRAQELTGKAMIVALTRGIAIKIYRKILEMRPTWTDKVKVVMSMGNKDPEDWQQIIGNDRYKQELAKKFKDDNDPMKIAIVRDMWLTGFDVPSLATMYVYKAMRGHNLMQAIARVNRVFPGKEGGLIVDYIGIAQALKAAMKQYTQRDQERFGNPDIAKTALVKWQEELEICRQLIHGYDYRGFFSDLNKPKADAITGGTNWLADPKRQEQRHDMVEHSRALHNASTLCRSLLTKEQKTETAYFDALRVMLVRLAQKGPISRHEINERISNLLNQSLHSKGVINLFDGHKLEFSLFDEAFLKELQKMKAKNLAVELLTKLLKEQLRKQGAHNVVQSDKFSAMLSMTLSNYLKGLLDNQTVIEELIKMAELMKQSEQEGNDLGLTPDEKAFYDALSKPEGVRAAYNDEQFVAMTKELTDMLNKNRTIDWNHKESARARMKVLVKRLLKKYKYPPENCEEALDIVMRQCDNWADNEDNFDSPTPAPVVSLGNDDTNSVPYSLAADDSEMS